MDRYLYIDTHKAIISDEMFMAVQHEKRTYTKNPKCECHGPRSLTAYNAILDKHG